MKSANIKSLWVGDRVFVRSRGVHGIFLGEASPGIVKIEIDRKVSHFDAADIFEANEQREKKAQTIKEEPIESDGFDLLANANFPRSIDLHIEALNAAIARKSPDEILRYQIDSAKKYVAKAQKLCVNKVYLIHGKGKGILRDTLMDVFRQNEDVASCRPSTNVIFGSDTLEVTLEN